MRTLFARTVADHTGISPFTDAAIIQAMTRFEVALAQAQSECGLIKTNLAKAIADSAETFAVDVAALGNDALQSASLAIPFVNSFTRHIAKANTEAAGYVHFGATSQDLIDTALVLCTREAVVLIDAALEHALTAIRVLAQTHVATPMLARTLLQPAGITTVGYTALQWIEALGRCRERMQTCARRALCVSLGGATGQLSTFGAHGQAIRFALAKRLGLGCPEFVWHTFRDDWITLAAAVATTAGVLQKIATDISLCMQAEVSEYSEKHAAGEGRSSALPHKRNPILTLRVLANAAPIPGYLSNLLSCMPQEHQRAFGAWQSEIGQWPMLFAAATDTAKAFDQLMHALQVNVAKCRENIDLHKGVVLSDRLSDRWSALIGKSKAMSLVATLCDETQRTGTPLLQLALAARQGHADLQSFTEDQLRTLLDVDQIAAIIAYAAESRIA